MSKSLFFLFSLVFLSTAARHSGGAWLGEVRWALRSEAHADIASLEEDMHAIRNQAERTPGELKSLWNDMCKYIREIEADAAADARVTGERISTLINTT